MKHFILITILFFYAIAVSSQKCNCPTFKTKSIKEKNEIGINLFSSSLIKNMPNLTKPFSNKNYFAGLMYKKHFNKNTFRVGFDYQNYNFFIEENKLTNYYHKSEGRNKMSEFRMGFERSLTTTKLQPYIAADLIYSYMQSKGMSGDNGVVAFQYSPYSTEIQRMGVAPAIGLKYYFCHTFSITAEADLSLVYSQVLYNKESSPKNTSGSEMKFNPLRILSVNYDF